MTTGGTLSIWRARVRLALTRLVVGIRASHVVDVRDALIVLRTAMGEALRVVSQWLGVAVHDALRAARVVEHLRPVAVRLALLWRRSLRDESFARELRTW